VNRKTGEILLGKGLISSEKLEEALLIQKKQGGRIGWILTTLGYIKRQDLFETLSEHFGKKFVSKELETILERIDKKLSKKIKKEDILNYQAIPYQLQGNKLIILNAYPGKEDTIEFFKKEFLDAEVEEWIITDLDLINCSKRIFGTEKTKGVERATKSTGSVYSGPKKKTQMIGVYLFCLINTRQVHQTF